ncbi:AraC family transcriptional regulator [Nocardioides speluncae]|uniref:AraC family transcriptional regulator n=1 Tax=Nocardioides speluncae TaxID=2670337 RepID=UPI000D696F3E|nr:AraC family transcriptional regulator [Nocardioides speluncae]
MGQWEIPRPATGVRHLLAVAEEEGVHRATCLSGTRLTPDAVNDPTSEIAVWQELTVARNLARALPDTTGIGVRLGRRIHVSAYGPAALAMLASATLRDGFDMARRFSGLLMVVSRTALTRTQGRTAIALDGGLLPPEAHRMLVERDIVAIIMAISEMTGRGDWPGHVELAFPPDGSEGLWTETVPCTPRLGAPQSRLVMSDEWLDTPLPQADPHSLWLALNDCVDMVERRRARITITDQVRDRLRSSTDHIPSIDQVAGSLLTTVRTLRRRLDAEGTSFRALADDVRHTIAIDLLTTHRLTVQQIATRLGYADASAFSHAFKRWTGVPPSEYQPGS